MAVCAVATGSWLEKKKKLCTTPAGSFHSAHDNQRRDKQWLCELKHFWVTALQIIWSDFHLPTTTWAAWACQTAVVIKGVVWVDTRWVMLCVDRGHNFSDQPVTLMDITGGVGIAGNGHAYGFWSTCHVCLPEWSCYGSCEGWARLVLHLHLPMSQVLLLWSWVSGGSQSLQNLMIYLLHLRDSFFFLCQLSITNLSSCKSVWFSLTLRLSHLHHFHTVSFINPSWETLARCVWPNLHIYKLWATAVQHPGTSCRSEAVLWSRAMAGLWVALGVICLFLSFCFIIDYGN